jgi:hypothetical protein
MQRLGAKSITVLVVPDREVAWQILALNTEKAHNLKERSLEVIRIYRGLLDEDASRPESSFAFYLDELDAAWVDQRIAAIEPAERRAGWRALRDGTYTIAYLQTVVDRLAAPVARVEKALHDGPWLAGPAFSVADIDAYPMLCVLPDLAPAVVNREATPRITDYLARIAARDSVRESLSMARTERPQHQFVPGLEAPRWG